MINIVPLAEVEFIPRVGEIVILPGREQDEAKAFEVVEIRYSYQDDYQPGMQTQARLDNVIVNIREIKDYVTDEEEVDSVIEVEQDLSVN